MTRISRQSILTVLLVSTAGTSHAFVPAGRRPSSYHECSTVHLGRAQVDILKQQQQVHAKSIATRPSRRSTVLLTQDRDFKSSTYLDLEYDESQQRIRSLLDDTPRSPSEEDYKIIHHTKEELQKRNKNRRAASKRSSVITAQQQQIQQQPDWVLPFSAAQREIELLQHKVQTIVNQPIVECFGVAAILLSSVLVAVITLPNIAPAVAEPIEMVQQILAYLFLAEFLTRWLSCTEKQGGYVTQPLVLVDVVVVVLPLILPLLADTPFPDFGQSGLITLRLLRVLRLQRALQDEMSFSKFVSAVRLDPTKSVIVQPFELQLARVVLSVFTLLSVAAGLIYTTEHAVNPAITDYFTALYFTLTTLTTVGFGDITPITWGGKLVVSCSILAGITVIPAQAGTLVEALLQKGEEEQKQQRQERQLLESATKPATAAFRMTQSNQSVTLEPTQKCPTCGAGLHWAHATYCYNCASPLQPEATLVLPDLA